MSQATSPMMRHYLQIKEKHQDCIIFYRLGDFYEMFFEDAELVSKELSLTLTKRDSGDGNKASMCGVPHHASQTYISRLTALGYKVAICEQLEAPTPGKGLVRRDVIRIITPATVLDDATLDSRTNSYLVSIYLRKDYRAGIATCDISTGEFFACSYSDTPQLSRIISELVSITPAEVVVNSFAYSCKNLSSFVEQRLSAAFFNLSDDFFSEHDSNDILKEQFNLSPGHFDNLSACAAASLISYLKKTQMTDLTHIKPPERYMPGHYMELGSSEIRNLELFETLHGNKKTGSLFGLLDQSITRMGSRTVNAFIRRPLLDLRGIGSRHDAVSELCKNPIPLTDMSDILKNIYDIERICARLALGSINCLDLCRLRASLGTLPLLSKQLSHFSSTLLQKINREIDSLPDIYNLLCDSIADEPPVQMREGGFIRRGFSEQLDALLHIMSEGKNWLLEYEEEQKQLTGIKNLKLGYNKVFGYYIEAPKSAAKNLPEEYTRKQTLSNCERFSTDRLTVLENQILGAKEKALALEMEIFEKIKQRLAAHIPTLQSTSTAIGHLDALMSFSKVAGDYNFRRPSLNQGDDLIIKDGRHPLCELMLKQSYFVPNDTTIIKGNNTLSLITGPNMAGKSTYMRQVALIVLMAQIGSFVPAQSAELCICDKVFTRIGASDNIISGKSTFMNEMDEVAYILNNATKQSLIILDEIGRGTSTYDGMSIAWAVCKYILGKIKAKTLFATHYHELAQLVEKTPSAKNFSVAVKLQDDQVFFLRKIVSGSTDKSYGVEVARLAGMPEEVLLNARKLLSDHFQGPGQVVQK